MNAKTLTLLGMMLLVMMAPGCAPPRSPAHTAALATVQAATSDAVKRSLAATQAAAPTRPPATAPRCVELSGQYKVVFIDGSADVYGGVDEPTARVKGTVTGGAGGIEATCILAGVKWYRLVGVDWWGWVKANDTYE